MNIRQLLSREYGIKVNPATLLYKDRMTSLYLDTQGFSFSDFRSSINTVRLDSTENRYLLVGNDDGSVVLLDTLIPRNEIFVIRKDTTHIRFRPEYAGMNAVDWFPNDNGAFFTAGKNGDIGVWNTNTQECVTTLKMYAQPLCFGVPKTMSQRHTSLLSGLTNNQIRVCDIRTQMNNTALFGHECPVSSVHYYPSNDTTVLSTSFDGTVIIWDLRTLRALKRTAPAIKMLMQRITKRIKTETSDILQQKPTVSFAQLPTEVKNTDTLTLKQQRVFPISELTPDQVYDISKRLTPISQPPPMIFEKSGRLYDIDQRERMQLERKRMKKRTREYAFSVKHSREFLFSSIVGSVIDQRTDDLICLSDMGVLTRYSYAKNEWDLVYTPEESEKVESDPHLKQFCITHDSNYCFFPFTNKCLRVDLHDNKHSIAVLQAHVGNINCVEINNVGQELYTCGEDQSLLRWLPLHDILSLSQKKNSPGNIEEHSENQFDVDNWSDDEFDEFLND